MPQEPWDREPAALRDAFIRLFATAIGWGLFALGCLVWGFVLLPAGLLLARFRPGLRDRLTDGISAWLRIYLRLLPSMSLRVDGRQRRCEGPCVLVANHQSFLDPIVLMSIEPRLSGPARPYLFRVPGLARVLEVASFYEAEIGTPAALESMRAACRAARRRGGALLFFPEGTRSRDGEIGPFHRGAFRLAADEGLPIQPVVIEGLQQVLPPQKLFSSTWRHPVRVRYLAPLAPELQPGPRRSAVRALAESAREAMIEELARLRSESKSLEGWSE